MKPFVIIIVVGIACITLTLALVRQWERRRARLLKQAGAVLGLRPYEKGERLAVPSVEIMRKRGRTLGAVLEGTWRGEPVMIFDLSYPAGRNISRTTVFLLRVSPATIPEFAAIRKNILLYTPTVDLPAVENAPSSLKHSFFLHTPEGDWPFGQGMAEWLAGTREWSFEGHGSGLFLYRRAKRVPPTAIREWLDEAFSEATDFLGRMETV